MVYNSMFMGSFVSLNQTRFYYEDEHRRRAFMTYMGKIQQITLM